MHKTHMVRALENRTITVCGYIDGELAYTV
jgi:hypothetical protein